MADLQKPIRRLEQRLGETSREILRIEAHIRRGEPRAASARIKGVRDQIESMEESADTALQLAVVGGQLGMFSGGGSWIRGRIPAAVVCAVGGWMYGQSLHTGYRRELQELKAHLDFLESQIAESTTTESSDATQTASGGE